MDEQAAPQEQPQASPQMDQPQGQPSQGPNKGQGGAGRRRRRRRKGGTGGGQAQGQPNGQGGQPHRAQGQGQGQGHRERGPRHDGGQGGFGQRRQGGGGGQGGRRNRPAGGRGGRRQPAAFVGPMDHSYRAPNGNVADGPNRGAIQARYPQQEITAVTSVSADAPAVIFCFIEDLFFLAKINETARKLGIKVEFVKTVEPVLERASDDIPEAERPSLAIVDLANLKLKPLDVIKKLRSKLKKSVSIIGFIPHVEGELKLKAQEAGCDTVMPRSAFSQTLPNLLRRYGAPDEDENIGNQ